MTKKEQILELREQGFTYRQIEKTLGCSSSLISYYCTATTKPRMLLYKQKLRLRQHPFKMKLDHFVRVKQKIRKHISTTNNTNPLRRKVATFNRRGDKNTMITLEQVQAKFGDSITCYLTGEPIDITKPSSYQFDHKIPVSKSGDNSIDNLGICTKRANQAKSDLTQDEFVALCKMVLIHHGYKVEL